MRFKIKNIKKLFKMKNQLHNIRDKKEKFNNFYYHAN